MKHTLLSTLVAVTLSGCATLSQDSVATASTAPRVMKVAFDVTDGNPQVLIAKLTVIELTRKQLVDAGITPKMVIAFRGDASYYTQTNLGMIKEGDRADALAIAAKLRELKKADGVEALEQCNVPLASRKLKPTDVMQEVKVVPNGWISLVNYQEKGYSYIVP
jgi:intracellular sulfur oxidation DsrE/DsrF family protein